MAGQRRRRTVWNLAARWRRLRRAAHSPAVHAEPGLYSIEQFRAALEREKARAERNGHGVSLVIMQTNHHDNGGRERPALAGVLKGRIRIMDEAGWFDRSRIGVLMPYTSREGAWHMVDDMCRRMNGALFRSDCRVYTYPSDWFNRDEAERGRGAGGAREDRQGDAHAEAPISASGATAGSCRIDLRGNSIPEGPGDPPAAYPFAPRPETGSPPWQRTLDIAGAALGLVILSPLFLLTALAIKVVSPGPVLFKQERIGRGGRPFMLWKFRTMMPDADTSIHQNHMAALIRDSNHGAAGKPMNKLQDDPRLIPFGRILRGTCIDELPQLINVLRGEMSLVGPRPPIPYEAREYLPWQRRRFDTMPGLTGLWQVSGKNRLTFEEMIRLDIRYGRTKCLWRAIAILCRTPRAIAREMADARVCGKVKVGVSEHG